MSKASGLASALCVGEIVRCHGTAASFKWQVTDIVSLAAIGFVAMQRGDAPT